ncbi:MAG: hypothetical protein ABTQ32_22615 [Myxococcaceae bacterium]
MWPIVMAVVGVVLGGALGVVATVFVFAALHLGSGSYEDVLPAMLLTLPAGTALGGFLGALLGRRLGRR